MSSRGMAIVNLRGYLFVPLGDELGTLRSAIEEQATTLDMRGTVLLAPEGINLSVAGRPDQVRQFAHGLRARTVFRKLNLAETLSPALPFRRLKVRIRREIVTFGLPDIDPARRTAPHIEPATLNEWLDTGRPLTLLDTRNEQEVRRGSFKGAEHLNLSRFRDFSSAVERLPDYDHRSNLKPAIPIVTFCTGGIRCEKASAHLLDRGFQNVLQLSGGILRYFEEIGGNHYQGSCFVFDERVALSPDLRPATDPESP